MLFLFIYEQTEQIDDMLGINEFGVSIRMKSIFNILCKVVKFII